MATRQFAVVALRLVFRPRTTSTLIIPSKLTFTSPRTFHSSSNLLVPLANQTGTVGPVASSTIDSREVEVEDRNSAYLGEADSDDGFEANKEVYGVKIEAVDSTHSAYLGEADSNDGFEANRDVHGQKLEAVDASQSAYLGEGDSDDGHEANVAVNPADYDHKIEDAGASGMHGESGEGDGPMDHEKA